MDPDPLPFGDPPGPAPAERTGPPPTEDTEPPPPPDNAALSGTGGGGGPGGPTARGPSASFQAASGIQGRQFAEQCDTLLGHLGFELLGRRVLAEVGVEIDQEAVGPGGTTVWFEYKGSIQGSRPGLRRTDTLKKAIANGALLRAVPDAAPYVVVTSHLPEAGSGAAMLRAGLDLGYLADVVCLYDPTATRRLGRW